MKELKIYYFNQEQVKFYKNLYLSTHFNLSKEVVFAYYICVNLLIQKFCSILIKMRILKTKMPTKIEIIILNNIFYFIVEIQA